MNKYQEEFNLVKKMGEMSARERICLKYGIEQGRGECIEEYRENLKECQDKVKALEKELDSIKTDVLEGFAEWLIKYKVIPDGAMQELIRDYKGERAAEEIKWQQAGE